MKMTLMKFTTRMKVKLIKASQIPVAVRYVSLRCHNNPLEYAFEDQAYISGQLNVQHCNISKKNE